MLSRKLTSIWLVATVVVIGAGVLGRKVWRAEFAPAADRPKKNVAVTPLPLHGEVKHRAVSDAIPKDREDFGIGEEIDFWIDRTDDPAAVVSWQVLGGGTVYPVVGISTTAKVDLSDKEGQFRVEPTRRDPGKFRNADANPEQSFSVGWLQQQIDALPKTVLKPVDQIPPPEPEFTDELQRDLFHKLDAVRDGPRTEVGRVDELGREMLKKYSAPNERGQVYFFLAQVHAQCGLQDPQRVIEYATKALEHPLEVEQIPRLYVYWGDALQLANVTASLSTRRRTAAIPYLAGLKTVLRFKLPRQAPELPGVNLFDVIGLGKKEAEQEHQRQLAARKLAEFQSEMIQHREVLAGQLRALYWQEPRDVAELRLLADRVLGNPPAVEWLIETAQDDQRRKANHE